ncbi:MAG TPA: hypothetical protein DCQ37_21110 [Desulfobacteraceae bacterium]|nr:hypothetical protein [Desulfobacteraceae bacterium]
MNYSLQIIGFHRIMPEGESYFIPPMAMSCQTFSKLMAWLAKMLKIIDLDDAAKRIRAGEFRGQAVAITFDDGYKDNFDIAREILKKAGIPATFFVPVHPIDKGEPYWWDYLYHTVRQNMPAFCNFLKHSRHAHIAADQPLNLLCRSMVRYLNGADNAVRLSFFAEMFKEFGNYTGGRTLMTWEEIRQMQQDGFSIGSHSLSHTPLTDLTPDQAKFEIEQSKIILSQRLGTEVSGFCYPRGAWNKTVADIAKHAGYAYAATTIFGSNTRGCNLYALARRNMSDYQGIRAHFPIPAYLLEMTGILDKWLSKRR